MEWREIKKIANACGGIAVIEDGEIKFVIVPYEKFAAMLERFKELSSRTPSGGDEPGAFAWFQNGDGDRMEKGESGDEPFIEKLNQEIGVLKEEIAIREQELATLEP